MELPQYFAEAMDIVGVVIFFASVAANYVTGHDWAVNGGFTIWWSNEKDFKIIKALRQHALNQSGGKKLVFKAVHYAEVAMEEVEEAGAKGVRVRWLISKRDGAENFAMRYFEVEPGGQTPDHSHDWEHEVFILNGKGLVVCNGSEKKIGPGYVVFVPPNAEHCFKNNTSTRLCLLCLVPYKI